MAIFRILIIHFLLKYGIIKKSNMYTFDRVLFLRGVVCLQSSHMIAPERGIE